MKANIFFNTYFVCAEMLLSLVLGGESGAEIHHFIQTEFLLMLKSTSTKMLIKPFLHPQRNHLRGSHWGTKVGSNNLIGG
jgi:hypothetical protein